MTVIRDLIKEYAPAAAAGTVVAVVAYVLFNRGRPGKPKGYRPVAPGTYKVTDSRVDATRDHFSPKKIPDDLDVIIIGSGPGGLYAAGLLARVGQKVLVLEQHYVAGGCTHAFEDKGFEFDTGVHYIGDVNRSQGVYDMVSSKDKRIKWQQMGSASDGFTYDEVCVADSEPVHFRAGKQQFIDELSMRFPGEKANIEKYVKMVQASQKTAGPVFFASTFHPLMEKFVHKTIGSKFFTLGLRSLGSVLREVTQNTELRAVLAGQCGDHGCSPDEVPFFVHASIQLHYLYGAYYPIGGSQKFSEAIIPVIEASGGRVLVSAPVESILLDQSGTTAYGVRMADGTEITAPTVISAAGYEVTYKKLIPEDISTRLGVLDGYESGSLDESVSHCYLFVGMDQSSKDLNLRSTNIWHLPCDPIKHDLHEMSKGFLDDPWGAEGMPAFIGFPSAKDPTYDSRHPGTSTGIVIIESRGSWFADYRDSETNNRPEGYAELKKKLKDRMLQVLYKYYPQCEGHVVYAELGTPLTNKFYLGRESSYGLKLSIDRYKNRTWAKPGTPIKNLYLTGQDSCMNGVVGGIYSAVMTCHQVLGYGAWDLLVMKRNLMEDIHSLGEPIV